MKIDVIIPAYKAQNTIIRTLSSIAMQNVISEIKVTIVNDADGIGYQHFVDMFSPYMDIQEIVMEKNGGPGDARQYGIDHTDNPLLTFIDADDTFAGAFSLYVLREMLLKEPVNACCFSSFMEENINNTFVPHQNDRVWMFGKIYKREFLNRYKIKFKEGSRANEDAGFNMICQLCSNQNEQIKYIPDTTYFWHFKSDSITRINNGQYSYDQSYVGYTDNMIYAIKYAESINPFNQQVMLTKAMVMCNLYEYYIETVARDSRFIEQNFNCAKRFYDEVYKEIEPKVTDEVLAEVYNEIMRGAYAGNKLFKIIPSIGIKEFLCIKVIEESAAQKKSTENILESLKDISADLKHFVSVAEKLQHTVYGNGQAGLVDRVAALEEWRERVNETMHEAKGGGKVVAFLFGIFATIAGFFLERILNDQ